MEKKKVVGLVTNFTPDPWPETKVAKINQNHLYLKERIQFMNYDVVDFSGPIREVDDIRIAGKRLKAEGVCALVLYIAAWTYADYSVELCELAGIPIIVWCDAETASRGLVGGSIVRGALSEHGIYNELIFERLDNESALNRLRKILKGFCAASSLKYQTIGVGGCRTLGMTTASIDAVQVKKVFGITIETFEQSTIINLAKKIDKERVNNLYKWINKTYGRIICNKEALDRQIRLYIALESFCMSNNYNAVACRCLPELPEEYTSFCLAHALLGDAIDDRGKKGRFIMACEGDINAALTMQLLHEIQDGPVMFTDLSSYDFIDRVLICLNCGSHPTDFSNNKKDIILEKEGVHNVNWSCGGTSIQFVASEGPCTLARLYRESGRYRLFISRASIKELPKEKAKDTVWERPHVYLSLDFDMGRFVEAVRSNHIHIIKGDYVKELVFASKAIGIDYDMVI